MCHYAKCRIFIAECRYAECLYVECRRTKALIHSVSDLMLNCLFLLTLNS
jgi:hypothetical protein